MLRAVQTPRVRTLALLAAGLSIGACGPSEPRSCLAQAPLSWVEDGLITEQGGFADGVTPNLRILSINVGNNVLEAGAYSLRVADHAYEGVIAAKLQALAPDIIGIQEVMPVAQCQRAAACPVHPDANALCEPASGYLCEPLVCADADGSDQVRRLVGPDYTIVCPGLREGGVSSVDCLAIHTDFGRVVDYHDGELLPPASYRPEWGADAPDQWSFWAPQGFEPCDFLAGECSFKGTKCDAESSLLWADVAVGPEFTERIRVVHLHPAAVGERCREHQLAKAFAAAAAHWQDPGARTLMVGDWNFDPERFVLPVEEALYYAYVGPTRRLHEHDERDEGCARVKTGPHIAGQRPGALDRVVTDFAVGFCQTYDGRPSAMHGTTLAPFDGGQGPAQLPDTRDCRCCYAGDIDEAVMDHTAVLCDLLWPGAPYPERPLPPP